MSRRVLLVAIAAASVAVLAVAGGLILPRLLQQPMTVHAQFEDAVGLYVGNGVAVLGMPVGSVSAIAAHGTYVDVTLSIDHRVDIPADVHAVTLSNSLLTDRVVELTPPYRGGPKLKNGDILGLGRTRTPVEFDRTLATMDKLGTALRGDAGGHGPLGDLINVGARISSANGPDLKATLDQLSQALRVGADKGAHSAKNIQTIVTSIADLTKAAADNDTAIRRFGSDLHQLSSLLADENLGAGRTGAKANELLAEAARLLESHRDGLRKTTAGARAILGTVTDDRRDLEETLDVLPLMVDNLNNTLDPVAGSVRVHALADKIVLNGQYSKELCNLLGLKQLGCATGTSRDYGPDFGLTTMLDLMGNGIGEHP